MSTAGTTRESAERRWVVLGLSVVAAVLLLQLVVGVMRAQLAHDPSALALVQRCLTERNTAFEPAIDDAVAASAGRGALRAEVGGNSVTVALGSSDRDAERLYDAYVAVAPAEIVQTRLDRNRRVVLVWENEPTSAQREFMDLCTLDAQD